MRFDFFCLLSILLTLIFIACPCVSAAEKTVEIRIASDSDAIGYPAYQAMDGNPKSIWHTNFSDGAVGYPHEITFDLGAVYEISGFEYIPRSDGTRNGTIKDFEFYVSDDAKKFGPAFTNGTFQNSDSKNTVLFDGKPAKGRYIRLRALSEISGRQWTSIAELRLISEGVRFVAKPVTHNLANKDLSELQIQYEVLKQDLKKRDRITHFADQTFHADSLILKSDRDPLDIVLRRTDALLNDLKLAITAAKFNAMSQELDQLIILSDATEVSQTEKRFELFEKASKLRRKIAFSNPLLDFDKILFIKRHRATFNHMCDQYYGINVLPGGGVCVISNPFSDDPQVKDILADSVVDKGRLKGQNLTDGSFLSPDLSYDGDKIIFAYVECKGDTEHRHHTDPSKGHWNQQRSYHLFSANVDGSSLTQLTDGTWNDFDPVWLPNGRVAFITERRGGYLRCGRTCPTYTLYDMAPNGSDIRCLSPHETNEWQPSVTNDGMIIYTRWDYVDRHGCTAHQPWITYPDGRDSRSVHGNFSRKQLRPDMELDIRAIPDSRKFISTAAPHHGQSFGSLVMVDPQVEDDDAMAPLKRITPEVDFPETQGGAQVYGTPWPLSEKYYICAYDPSMTPGVGRQGKKATRGDYGIYLVDVFGNKELIYRDPEIASQSPMPLRPRTTPPVIPDKSIRVPAGTDATATLAVVNVYDTLKPWDEDLKITDMRVYQILPMTVPSGNPPHEISLREPTAGDSVVLARYVLGTVSVEKDGSAYLTVPADKELFFQVLDENGLAIQSMRSATYLKPGENLVCQGCHEPKQRAPQAPKSLPLAMRRAPSKLRPDVDGTNPFSYPRLVQPVLEKNCLECHQKHPDKAPRLDSEVVVKGRQKWYASYFSLTPKYGFWSYGDSHRTIPGKFGARASKLYKMLKDGHHDVKLSKEDMHCITIWLDSCSIFYGVYEKEGGEAQLRGEIAKPTLE